MTKPKRTPGLFGRFDVDNDPYTVINIGKASVDISEFRSTRTSTRVTIPRLTLPRATWGLIAPTLTSVLNAELAEDELPKGRFIAGENKLCIDNVGKEAQLLCWAVEDTEDPLEISSICSGWASMHRVERWWMFNQTAQQCGDPRDRGHGWRVAIRHALGSSYRPTPEN